MRLPKSLLAAVLILTGSACKTSRPTVTIRETPVEQTPLNSIDSSEVSTLKISALSLPSNAKKYSRISITIESEGIATRSLENYKLNEVMSIKPYRTYILTARVYLNDVMTYSNEYCSNSRSFKSKLGVNNYTVPLCGKPEDESSTSEGTLIEPNTSTMEEAPEAPAILKE